MSSRNTTGGVAKPLPQKLGILVSKGAPCVVSLMGEPEGFRASLGDLPQHVSFIPDVTAQTTLAICFVRTLADLNNTFELLTARLPATASAWIVRPKQHLKPGFNENDVREGGLAREMVDYKICSFDDIWSGVKFARRRPVRVSKA